MIWFNQYFMRFYSVSDEKIPKNNFKELDFKSIGIETPNQYYNIVIRVK